MSDKGDKLPDNSIELEHATLNPNTAARGDKTHRCFELLFIVSQIVIIILYAFTTEYGEGVHPAASATDVLDVRNNVQIYYPVFQDVHVMIFIGFGFLMVFLKSHSWTSIGFNFLIAAYALQISILITGYWHMLVVAGEWHKITLDLPALIIGDFGAGAVLITFGALLGKCSIHQLWVVATLEIIFYGLNEAIGAGLLMAVDMGGSMYVHTFGAYFGLAAAFFFSKEKAIKDVHGQCDGGYVNQMVAMVGTLFLWMFWPSFNGALAGSSQQQRVIVNTVLAISASCVTACGVSRMMYQKLDMEVVLNATLAGGVAVGSASDLVVTGAISMVIGSIAGILSALGFLKLGPWLQEKIGLHDTCGVHNLHGMPGVLGGIIGSISAASAGATFGDVAKLNETFPGVNVKLDADGSIVADCEGVTGNCWDLQTQAGKQLAALGVTLCFSIIGGAFTGFIAGKCCNPERLFDDTEHFMHVPTGEDQPSERTGMIELSANAVAPIDAGCVVSDPQ